MQTKENPRASSSARVLTYAAYASFIPIGIATILLGPMLPILSARWALTYSQAGALFPAQYVAATCAVGLSGVIASRCGFRLTIALGLLLTAVGLAFLLAGPKALGVLSIGAYGMGLGIAVPAANLLVAAVNPERRSAKLNVLNFFWSTGAVACPFLVAASAKTQHLGVFLLIVAGFALAVAIGITLMRGNLAEPPAPKDKTPFLDMARGNRPAFVILAVLFFLYVGVENGFGEWMASYVKSLGTLPLATALATPSFFYCSLMLGRWLAPGLLRFVSELRLAQTGLLLACAGMAGLLFSHGLAGVGASAIAGGLGLSCVYPITISFLSREFASARIGSLMFVLSNIGGGLLPWMVGVSSERAGTLKAGFFVPLLGCLMMYVCYLLNWTRRASPADSPQR